MSQQAEEGSRIREYDLKIWATMAQEEEEVGGREMEKHLGPLGMAQGARQSEGVVPVGDG